MNFKAQVPATHITAPAMSKELRKKHGMHLGSVGESSTGRSRHWDPEGWVVSSRDGRRKGREMRNSRVYFWE